MKSSSFAVAAVLLLLAAHAYVTDAAAFGEVSIIGVYVNRFKQRSFKPIQYSNDYSYFPTVMITS